MVGGAGRRGGLARAGVDAAEAAEGERGAGVHGVARRTGDVFHEYNATAGTLVVDSVEADETATGSFEDLAFEDGTLSGSFTAEHCVNLKP